MANPQAQAKSNDYGKVKLPTEPDLGRAENDDEEVDQRVDHQDQEDDDTVETAAERANTMKFKTKIESKRSGAGLSLKVLESKVDQGRFYDEKSPAEIASINPWEDLDDDTDRTPAQIQKIAEHAAIFGCALSVLLRVGSMGGVDVSTPDKLIAAVRGPNFPITPNATELTAVTKLEEIYSTQNSPWKTAFEETYWEGLLGHAVHMKEKNVPGVPRSTLRSPATNPEKTSAEKGETPVATPAQIQQTQADKPVQSTGEAAQDQLSKMWEFAKENPGTALLYTGVALAAVCGIYQFVKCLLKDTQAGGENKEGAKEEGGFGGKILTYLLGAGAVGGGAYGLFSYFRDDFADKAKKNIEDAVLDKVTGELDVDKKTAEGFIQLLRQGKKDEAMDVLINGKDKDAEYHKAAALRINSEANGETLTGRALYAFKDTPYKEFTDTSILEDVGLLNGIVDNLEDLKKDIPLIGNSLGIPGLDGEKKRIAMEDLRRYFKLHENQLTEHQKEGTVGSVLRILLPVGSPALKVVATHTPPPTKQEGAAENKETDTSTARLAKATATASGVAAGVTGGASLRSIHKGGKKKKEVEVVQADETDEIDGTQATWAAVDASIKTEELSADSAVKRDTILQTFEQGSDFRKRLATNENLLSAMPTIPEMRKAISDIKLREEALNGLMKKTKSEEERAPIQEKIDEIKGYRAALIKCLPANEAAAENYLAAMQSGDEEQVQKAIGELTIVKDRITEVLHEALTREGWGFLEHMMVARGIHMGWQYGKKYIFADDLREENAKYIFGKMWGKVKSLVSGSLRGAEVIKGKPMEMDEIEKMTRKMQKSIDKFHGEVRARNAADEELGSEFFHRFRDLEEEGVRIQTDIQRRIADADEKLAAAMRNADESAAEEAIKELNRCYKASAKLEAGVVHSIEKGFQVLTKFGPLNIGHKPISTGDIITSALTQKDYEGGLQQLRSVFKTCIKNYKKHNKYSLFNHLKPKGGTVAVLGLQMVLGGAILRDEQTTFTEGAWQTAQMATPVLGTYLDAKQAITGYEAFGDNPHSLDWTDRGISGAFAVAGGISDVFTLCGLGFVGREVLTGIKTYKGLKRLQNAQEMLSGGVKALKGKKIYELNKKIHLGMGAAAVAVIGTQVLSAGVEKLDEVQISEGAYREIYEPLMTGAENVKQSIDAKIEKIAENP